MRCQMCTVAAAVLGTALGACGFANAAPEEKRGFLGVMVIPAGEGERGVMVQDVYQGGPAAKAGLKTGDRILKIGDQEPKDVDGFLKSLANHKPGDKVTLTINRGGKEQTISATLGERVAAAPRRPEEDGSRAGQGTAFLGVSIQPLTPELRKQAKLEVEEGAVIVEVAPNSPAEKAGLKHGDVITKVGDRAVKSPDELREAIQRGGAGKEITLGVVRGTEKLTVKATPQAGTVGYFPGEGGIQPIDGGLMPEQGRRMRDLERRIEELEKRIRELERRPGAQK